MTTSQGEPVWARERVLRKLRLRESIGRLPRCHIVLAARARLALAAIETRVQERRMTGIDVDAALSVLEKDLAVSPAGVGRAVFSALV